MTSRERARQVQLLLELVEQAKTASTKFRKDLLLRRVEEVRTILREGDALAVAFKAATENPIGDPLELMATVDTKPIITFRRGFFGSINSEEVNLRYPFGVVKIIIKHIQQEDPAFAIDEDDLRYIPVMLRRFKPQIRENRKLNNFRREWRVLRTTNKGTKELVLIAEDEQPRFNPESEQQTVLTFYAQNPKKMGGARRSAHPLSEAIQENS